MLPPPKPEVHPEPSPAELWVPKQSTRSPQLGHLSLSATTDTQPRSEPLEQFPSLPRSCTQTAHPCPSPSSSPPHQAHEPQLHLAASPAPSHPLPLISWCLWGGQRPRHSPRLLVPATLGWYRNIWGSTGC